MAWFDSRWFFDVSLASWRYVPAGEYEPGVRITDSQITHSLLIHEVDQLLNTLKEAHWIKPEVNMQLREEDVKIIHRLLDIIGNRE